MNNCRSSEVSPSRECPESWGQRPLPNHRRATAGTAGRSKFTKLCMPEARAPKQEAGGHGERVSFAGLLTRSHGWPAGTACPGAGEKGGCTELSTTAQNGRGEDGSVHTCGSQPKTPAIV